jgi:hypothetical protein
VLKVPTVDDWYCLSLKYRQFHRVSDTSLKDYGGKGARANWRKDHETATVRAGRKGLRSDVNRDSATLPREKDGPRPRCRPDAVEIIRRVDAVVVHKLAAVAAALTN